MLQAAGGHSGDGSLAVMSRELLQMLVALSVAAGGRGCKRQPWVGDHPQVLPTTLVVHPLCIIPELGHCLLAFQDALWSPTNLPLQEGTTAASLCSNAPAEHLDSPAPATRLSQSNQHSPSAHSHLLPAASGEPQPGSIRRVGG